MFIYSIIWDYTRLYTNYTYCVYYLYSVGDVREKFNNNSLIPFVIDIICFNSFD